MPDTTPRPSLAARLEARAAALSRPLRAGLAAGSGALAALAQAPFDLWPLGLVGLVGLFALFRAAPDWRAAALAGWAGGAGYFAMALFWIVEPFFVDPLRHGWMAPFAITFMCGGLALFWGAAFALARRLGGGALLWIAALTGAELARAYVLTGFPWALIGYVWAASPMARIGAIVGPHGLTLLALIAAASLWTIGRRGLRIHAAGGLALTAALFTLGLATGAPRPPAPDAPVIRLVQPNAPQHQKWDPDHIFTFFDRQLAFTAEQDAARPPDLIVWPETAIPWMLGGADQPLAMITQAAAETPVVLGLRRIDEGRLYNSLVLLDAQGAVAARYDKHHLVPFGEYVPLGDLAAKFGISGLAASDGNGFSAGPGAALIELPGIGPALPLICYEAVFPQDVNAAPARPRLLLQITNDAWFGRFSGPYQHLQQARMRAIEQGLPMLRVANTGVSAMIGPRGEVIREVPLGVAGYADAPLPAALPPTLYSRMGDWPVLLLVLLGLGAGAGIGRGRMVAKQAA